MIKKLCFFAILFSVLSAQAMDKELAKKIKVCGVGIAYGFLDGSAISFGIQAGGKMVSWIGGPSCFGNIPGIFDVKAKSKLAFNCMIWPWPVSLGLRNWYKSHQEKVMYNRAYWAGLGSGLVGLTAIGYWLQHRK